MALDMKVPKGYRKAWNGSPSIVPEVQHGVDCRKAPHLREGGYLHAEDDDTPYDVDGIAYCGRCHQAIGLTGDPNF